MCNLDNRTMAQDGSIKESPAPLGQSLVLTHAQPMRVRSRTDVGPIESKGNFIFKRIEKKPGAAGGYLHPDPRAMCPRMKVP